MRNEDEGDDEDDDEEENGDGDGDEETERRRDRKGAERNWTCKEHAVVEGDRHRKRRERWWGVVAQAGNSSFEPSTYLLHIPLL